MSLGWVPSDAVLSAWHRRFPDRRPFWTGRLRLWRAELAVRPADSLLATWVARAGDDAAGRLGLPDALVAAIRAGARQSFAFLELPGGVHAIPNPSDHFDDWPEPTTSVPAEVLKPAGVEVFPFTGHCRTVPLIRAELVHAMAGRSDDGIDLYAVDEAGELSAQPLVNLPADAIKAAELEERGFA
jgi:hypothetical protein